MLTPRQNEIGVLVTLGFCNKYIAQLLTITHRTVEKHITDMMVRLDIFENKDMHNTRVILAIKLRTIV